MLNFNDFLKECKYGSMKKEELKGNQHKLDKNKNGKLDADDFEKLRNEAKKCMDEDDMDESGLRMAAHTAHKAGKKEFEFKGKTYPVKVQKEGILKPELEKGFPARGVKTGASAPKGTSYMPKKDVKEEVEQIDELSKKTLGSYAHKAVDDTQDKAHDAYDSGTPTRHELEVQGGKNNDGKYGYKPLQNRLTGVARAAKRLGDKEISKRTEKSVAHHLKQRYHYDNMDDRKAANSDNAARHQYYRAKDRIEKASGVKEEVELDEGRMKDLAYDLDNMGHDEFHKQYGKPKSHFDPSNFKKPVQKGHEMDRARALAQRGIQSLSKEEVECIEEKLSQLDELSKKTLNSYIDKAKHHADWANSMRFMNDKQAGDIVKKREAGIGHAINKKLNKQYTKEDIEELDEVTYSAKGKFKHSENGHIELTQQAHTGPDAKDQKWHILHSTFKLDTKNPRRGGDFDFKKIHTFSGEDAEKQARAKFAEFKVFDGVKTEEVEQIDETMKCGAPGTKCGPGPGSSPQQFHSIDRLRRPTSNNVERHHAVTTTGHVVDKNTGKVVGHIDQKKVNRFPGSIGIGKDHNRILHGRIDSSYTMHQYKTNEETEQIDELSKKTLGSYINKAAKDSRIHGQIATDFENTADRARKQSKADSYERLNRKYLNKAWSREAGIAKAVGKLTKEEVQQEVSPYLKATLAVMDEGKLDDLRDAQKLRAANKSAYDKDYKADTSHPHITTHKGTSYGGQAQKDDEGDEKKDDEKQEKRGRGRPSGSKSGARQKGNGREDGGIPVHSLHLPNRNK